MRLEHTNGFTAPPKYFGQAGPPSSRPKTLPEEAPDIYKYDYIRRYPYEDKITKCTIKSNVCYVLIICYEHINDSKAHHLH